jgi:hypothetical protein
MGDASARLTSKVIFGLHPESTYTITTEQTTDTFSTLEDRVDNYSEAFNHLADASDASDSYDFFKFPEAVPILPYACKLGQLTHAFVRVEILEHGVARVVKLKIARSGDSVDLGADDVDGIVAVADKPVQVFLRLTDQTPPQSVSVNVLSSDVLRIGSCFYYPGETIRSTLVFQKTEDVLSALGLVMLAKSSLICTPETIAPRSDTKSLGKISSDVFQTNRLIGIADQHGMYSKVFCKDNAEMARIVFQEGSFHLAVCADDADGNRSDPCTLRPRISCDLNKITFYSEQSKMSMDERGLSLDSNQSLRIGNHRISCDSSRMYIEFYNDATKQFERCAMIS